MNISHLATTIKRILIRILLFCGTIFIVMLVLSFTDIPYYAYHFLGTHYNNSSKKPDFIVILGGGGMPGPNGLIRCYYGALAAEKYGQSQVIVAFPTEEEPFEESDHYAMKLELIQRGVSPDRILSERNGTNTITQARAVRNMMPSDTVSLLIITSPENMLRSVLTFKKQGFQHVNGLATFENSFDEALLIDETKRKTIIEKSQQNLHLRYNMWSYLQYEIIVIREWLAISYYWMMGYL